MCLIFIRMPGESYRRQLRFLLLCLCEGFRALINSLVCWFSIWTFYFCLIQNWEDYTFELPLCKFTIYDLYLFFLKHRLYSELADSTTFNLLGNGLDIILVLWYQVFLQWFGVRCRPSVFTFQRNWSLHWQEGFHSGRKVYSALNFGKGDYFCGN